MKELIKITEQNGKKSVSARDLYLFLEVGRDFSNWIRSRIEKYDLVQGVDYEAFNNFVECQNGIGGTTRKEYALSIDAAKELSMVEGNEKGKLARRYFIECERNLKQIVSTPQLPQNYIAALEALIESEKKKEQLAIEVAEQKSQLQVSAPKVEYHDKVLSSKSTYTTTQIAKELGMSGIRLNTLLKDANIQYKTRNQWLLSYKYQDKGYTKTSTYTYTDSNGETRSNMLTEWTEAGRKFIMDKMQKYARK